MDDFISIIEKHDEKQRLKKDEPWRNEWKIEKNQSIQSNSAYTTIKISFATEEAYNSFAALINQDISNTTKLILPISKSQKDDIFEMMK